MPRPWLPIVSVCLLATISQAALERHRAIPIPSNRPIQEPGGGYSGSTECRSCHPAEYASWHSSFHRTMTQVATPATLAGIVDGKPMVIRNVEHRLVLENGSYFATTHPVGAADSSADTRRQVVMLTGSHHQQVLWLEGGAGRSIDPFPFQWLFDDKRWVPAENTFLAPPGLGEMKTNSAWNVLCLNCHATNGRSRQTPDRLFDSKVTEFGISCESCHGEGAEHVRANQNPLRRYSMYLTDKKDPTIANPARMNGLASAMACGQCHSVWEFDQSHDLMAWNQNGTEFRPGQVTMGERKLLSKPGSDGVSSFWPDGMVRVTGREFNGVQASPCFAGGNFSCLSCHEMHTERTDGPTLTAWAPSQIKRVDSGNDSCLSCHPKIGAKIADHTHHEAGSSGSSCYNCHMPYTSYGLLGSVRSHQVSSPTAQESLGVGRPNACVLCHLDKPLSWSAEKLNTWYGTAVPPLSEEDRTVSAAVRWILKGDAGQRAAIAWSMGWEPAQKATGRDWLPPYLAITLNDPYAAVRYIAAKSLRSLPGYERFEYDYTAGQDVNVRAGNAAFEQFIRQSRPANGYPSAVLLDRNGEFEPATFNRFLNQRDHRPVYLVE